MQQIIVYSNLTVCGGRHRRFQSDLEAGIPVWAPKLGARKSFLVQYILSSVHSGKYFVDTQGLHMLKKRTNVR